MQQARNAVRRRRDGEDVRRELGLGLQRELVRRQHLRRVQRELPVRIHGQQQPAAARVDVAGVVPILRVDQDRVVVD